MKPIIIEDMPEEQYHAETGTGTGQFITRSMIHLAHKDPALFDLRYNKKRPLAQFNGNVSTDFGTYFESVLFDEMDNIIQVPDDHLTKSGAISTKQDTVKWLEDRRAEGGVLETPAMKEKAAFMVERCMYSKKWQWLREKVKNPENRRQLVVRWQDRVTELPLQVRIDIEIKGVCLIDIKTTMKALHSFSTTASDYGYDIQSVMYPHGYDLATGEKLPFAFATAQNKDPWETDILQLSDADLVYGDAHFGNGLKNIVEKNWYDENTKPTVVDSPAWKLYQHENEEGGE